MGRVGAELSDLCILTSDNPRSEEPERILDDIEQGVPPEWRDRVHRQADRSLAIAQALERAAPEDVVVIAGKGHEDYQEIEGYRRPFDDREVTRDLLRQASG